MVKCAKKKKKAVERKKKGLDRASIVRDGRFPRLIRHLVWDTAAEPLTAS
jgi:hypothetical protein